MKNKQILRSLCLLLLLSVGCGGGTSGTSDPDTAFIKGVVVSSESGLPVNNAEMYLINKDNDNAKVISSTNQNGEFDMVGSGKDFDVELINVSYPLIPFKRNYSGFSNIGLTLNLDFSNSITQAQIVEASFRINKECRALFSRAENLVQIAQGSIEECKLNISSLYNSQKNADGALEVICAADKRLILSKALDSNGEYLLTFSELKGAKCKSFEIRANGAERLSYPAKVTLRLLENF